MKTMPFFIYKRTENNTSKFQGVVWGKSEVDALLSVGLVSEGFGVKISTKTAREWEARNTKSA